MSLDTYFEQLRMAAEELETKDELRTAECRNIATVVDIVRQRVKLGMYTKEFLETTLEEIMARLNFLARNPTHAGQHEIHRPTIIPGADEPEIEVMPKSEKRLKNSIS